MNISVCIATYNGEKYIIDQLQSILKQLGEGDEVVISDDSSTDKTVELVKALQDKRIRIIEHQQFRSPIFNFENSFRYATNDYIFMSDQDDLWLEGKVAAMKKELEHYDMVVCDHSVIDDDGNMIISSYFEKVRSGPGILLNMRKNTYYGCCMAFHKKVLYKAMPFPKDIPMHDIWLGFVADVYFRSKFIAFPYTQYRKHDNNVTSATDTESNSSFFEKIRNRTNYLKYWPLLLSRKSKQTLL